MTDDDAFYADRAGRAGITVGFFLLGAYLTVLALAETTLLTLPLVLSGPAASPLAGLHAFRQALTRKGDW